MIAVYIYDGSFEGLMTSVYEAYYNTTKPEEIVSTYDYTESIIHNKINIVTDEIKSDKVITAIKNKISYDTLQNVFYVYLSSIKDSDTLLYKYIRLGFSLGSVLDQHLHNDIVSSIHKIVKKVQFESHNMLGFIRFREISPNFYYSQIEPDHNILYLIAPHFSRRLSSQNWIIHDLKRGVAALYNGEDWVIHTMNSLNNNLFTHEIKDSIYEKLWKEYFNTIAIKERTNPKQQSRFMPKRYWKHLTELS
jgi:probable DNA metabolism protein